MKVCSVCGRCYEDSALSCSEDNQLLPDVVPAYACESVPNYRLETLVQTTPLGDVYRASQLILKKNYLVRIIGSGAVDEAAGKMILSEARKLSSVIHPGVARIFESGSLADGSIYIVSELFEAQTLRECFENVGAPDEVTAVMIARQAAEALEAIHSSGVCHKNLRPENTFLTKNAAGELQVKLQNADLGGLFERNVEANGDLYLNALRYFSPEQCEGNAGSIQSDAYALGVMFHEMLDGTPPFDSPYADALIAKHLNDSPPPVKIERFDIRMLISHTLSDALQKQTRLRIKTASAFARRLRHIEQLATHSSTPPPAVAHLSARAKPQISFAQAPRSLPKPLVIAETELLPDTEPQTVQVAAAAPEISDPLKEAVVDVIPEPIIVAEPIVVVEDVNEAVVSELVVGIEEVSDVVVAAPPVEVEEMNDVVVAAPVMEVEKADKVVITAPVAEVEVVNEAVGAAPVVAAEKVIQSVVALPAPEIVAEPQVSPFITQKLKREDVFEVIYPDLSTTKLPPIETVIRKSMSAPVKATRSGSFGKMKKSVDNSGRPILVAWDQPDDVPSVTQALGKKRKDLADAAFAKAIAKFLREEEEVETKIRVSATERAEIQPVISQASTLFGYDDSRTTWKMPRSRNIATGAGIVLILVLSISALFIGRSIWASNRENPVVVQPQAESAVPDRVTSIEPASKIKPPVVIEDADMSLPDFSPREAQSKPSVAVVSPKKVKATKPVAVKTPAPEVLGKTGEPEKTVGSITRPRIVKMPK